MKEWELKKVNSWNEIHCNGSRVAIVSLESRAKAIINTPKLYNILIELDKHIDFDKPLDKGDLGIENVEGINEVFKNAYKLINQIEGDKD